MPDGAYGFYAIDAGLSDGRAGGDAIQVCRLTDEALLLKRSAWAKMKVSLEQ